MISKLAISVLIFSATGPAAYRHASIPAGIAGLWRVLSVYSPPSPSTAPPAAPTDYIFNLTASEDPAIFTPESLSRFSVVVLLQAGGVFLPESAQVAALRDFVHQGGRGLVTVHSASTGFPGEVWYTDLVGASFTDHPLPQEAVVRITAPTHPVMAASLGKGASCTRQMPTTTDGTLSWRWMDEWYNFAENPSTLYGSRLKVLMTVDEASYEGGKHGGDHPVAWCQEFEGGGRSFYTALGHFDEAYADDGFMAQLRAAIIWAAKVE